MVLTLPNKGNPLYLYLLGTNNALSSVLVQEEERGENDSNLTIIITFRKL